jgi:hypothetical protein
MPQLLFLLLSLLLLQAMEASKGRVKVLRPMWVSKMTAAPKLGGWQLTGVRKDQGTYGAVVIAHNGKCANRWVLRRKRPGLCAAVLLAPYMPVMLLCAGQLT